MTIEEMKSRKRELGYSYAKIAELSGVPVGTVQKILGGFTASPRYETLTALEKVFEPDEKSMLQDEALRYNGTQKTSDSHTLSDYLALPEDRRVEMIDGVFYDMSAPLLMHQIAVSFLNSKLLSFINSEKGNCITFIAPTDVQLDCDDKTIVQPDVFVVCDRNKLQNGKRVFGAPDLIIEILSDSTKNRDMYLKSEKYRKAGVREYWLVDLKKEKIIVNDFEHEDLALYGFEEKVPVGIFGGKYSIRMKEMKETGMNL
ncbi:MAG TPA: Uma2 family endonuclease [Lachnospiraceae bacterium]|nr:Uma2 family endonuclease [Lachnospiraceae bacterium]